MAAGKGRQSRLNSLGLKEHTFAALWGLLCPKGPFYLRGVSGLPAEGIGRGRRGVDSPADRPRL